MNISYGDLSTIIEGLYYSQEESEFETVEELIEYLQSNYKKGVTLLTMGGEAIPKTSAELSKEAVANLERLKELPNEVHDFNIGIRQCVLITKGMLSGLKDIEATKILEVSGRYLVAREQATLEKYLSLSETTSHIYALGTVLGYPPLCVQWFNDNLDQLGNNRVFIQYSSIVFSTPLHLVNYALNYLATEYSFDLDKVVVHSHREKGVYSLNDNPFFQFNKEEVLNEQS